MALTRYNHFWGFGATQIPVAGAGDGDIAIGTAAPYAFDMRNIVKAYSPPRFIRELREVEVGQYVNEQILGRLNAAEMNFSLTMPADFEALYAFNHDYKWKAIRQLHNRTATAIRYRTDIIEGTLFDREEGDYMHNGQDQDITLHLVLKTYERFFSNDEAGQVNKVQTLVINRESGHFWTRGRTGATATAPNTLASAAGSHGNMFGQNYGVLTS